MLARLDVNNGKGLLLARHFGFVLKVDDLVGKGLNVRDQVVLVLLEGQRFALRVDNKHRR